MKTVLLTACGPSLDVDAVTAVRGAAPLIAVSDTIKLFPWADEMIAIDRGWWERRSEGAQVEQSNARRWAGIKACKHHGERFNLHQFIIRPMPTSGHGALLLARQLGYKRMLLAGYNMGGAGGSHHYFKTLNFENSYPGWVGRMKMLYTFLTKKGIEVVNCTKDSSLTFIPYTPLREAI